MRYIAFVVLAMLVFGGLIMASPRAKMTDQAPAGGIDTLSLTKAAKDLVEQQYPAH